ncbi:MAG: serine hydrolase domain-containing protein [Burkholderiaceae bacterium]
MPDSIELMLNYHQQSGHYPGAVVHIEKSGEILSRQQSGRCGPDPQAQPVTEQARFRIASLTKPMVSLVAMRLIEQGLVSLETPVAEVLPELADLKPAADAHGSALPTVQPTIRHLLTHTAGFMYAPEIRSDTLRKAALDAGLGKMSGMSRSAFLAALGSIALVAQPGTRFLYGYSTDVLGLVIERLAKQDLEQAMKTLLFEPLGMTRSGFRADPDEYADMPRAFDTDQAWHRFYDSFESVERSLKERSEQQGADPAQAPLLSGGGGLVSTLDDVVLFARALANRTQVGGGELLSAPYFEQMVSNHLPDSADGPNGFIGSGWGFGLGGAVRHPTGAAAVPANPGEFTWSGVTGQSLFVDPSTGWFAIMLSSNTASRVMVRLEFRRAASLL